MARFNTTGPCHRESGKTTCFQALVRTLTFFAMLLLPGCSGEAPERPAGPPAPTGPFHFTDVAADAGIDFHHFDSQRAALLPEDNGSGLAFGDYDNDGFDDLYIANLAGPALMPRQELRATRQGGRLFHNQGGGADGRVTFAEVTEAAGVTHVGWDAAAVWGDVDGDGWLDLLITGLDEIVLFRNLGDGRFEDHSAAAGLGDVVCEANGPALGDYDRDGDLDLYVPCYVDFPWDRARNRPLVGGRPGTMTTPANYPPQPNLLLRNDGRGHFEDVAAEAGVLDDTGRGLQAVFVDLDDDGWQDLYVANDQSFDRLYRNLGDAAGSGDAVFEDLAIPAGTRDPRAGMGIAVGDYDEDGAVDVFLTHWVGEENALYRNATRDGLLLFEDRTVEEGLAPADASWVGWGTAFVDVDLDGDQDVFLVNGSTVEDEWTLEVLSDPKMIPQPLRLYARQESTYTDVSEGAGEVFAAPIVGRGAAFADYDRDGLVDVAVQVHNGAPLLLRNRSQVAGHWLGVQLVGEGANGWAVGAKVTARTADASRVRWRLVGESYASCNSATLHFGLGAARRVEALEVRWPSGETSSYSDLPVDRIVRIRQNTAEWEEVPAVPQKPRPWGAAPGE